jgi:hypothetical protein
MAREWTLKLGVALLLVLCAGVCLGGDSSHREKAVSFKQALEEAVNRGDFEVYAELMREFDAYTAPLSREERVEFSSYWSDPPFNVWLNLMVLRITSAAAESPAEVVRHTIEGLFDNNRTRPRVINVEVQNTTVLIAFRNYLLSGGREGRLYTASDTGVFLKYLGAEPRLSHISRFEVDVYQHFEDEESEEVVMRVALPRRAIEKIGWGGHVSVQLLSLAESEGTLWVHPRLRSRY